MLYEDLAAAIGPLVALLADEEDKTRANAAGALGNLVRNSGQLCGALLASGALQVRRARARAQNQGLGPGRAGAPAAALEPLTPSQRRNTGEAATQGLS